MTFSSIRRVRIGFVPHNQNPRKPSGMGNVMSQSFAPECTEAKTVYDECFNKWYTEKFLQGKGLYNECTDLWDNYITCVNTALAHHKIKPMLDQAREDQPFAEDSKSGDKD